MTTLFDQRRFGRFSFTQTVLKESPGIIQKIFKKAIPVDIRYDIMNELYNVQAFSSEFDQIVPGQIVPEYTVLIHTRNRKTGAVDPVTLIPVVRRSFTIEFKKK